jgi:SAM-dependent methyltransferase
MSSVQSAPKFRYPPPFRYTDRLGKARYIAQKYAPILTAGVLDVGCDRKQLLEHLPTSVRYIGVDVCPGADVIVDLDRRPEPGERALPFEDGAFDTVIAADVLEHLERIHAIFDEICRVSSARVIISLPNPVRNFVLAAAEGSQGRLKFYGLPVDPPADRHRWFFGADEAEKFLRERGARNGFTVEQLDVEEHGCPAWNSAEGKNLFSSRNVTHGTTWCVLRRA